MKAIPPTYAPPSVPSPDEEKLSNRQKIAVAAVILGMILGFVVVLLVLRKYGIF